MRVSHGRISDTGSIKQGANVTGDIWADPVIAAGDLAAVNHVFFAPRSRTYWHRHRGGQILHVTSGSGWVSSRTGGIVQVKAGDVVWSDPDEVHWHGADDQTYLLHTAISLAETYWLEPVTDEEYLAALATRPRP
jgi:quercetin dioxygenase-like cupin family protein